MLGHAVAIRTRYGKANIAIWLWLFCQLPDDLTGANGVLSLSWFPILSSSPICPAKERVASTMCTGVADDSTSILWDAAVCD